jgi:Mg2+-importing ATPase
MSTAFRPGVASRSVRAAYRRRSSVEELFDAEGKAVACELLELASLPPDTVLRRLRSSRRGLSDRQAVARLTEYGQNTLPARRQPSWPARLWVAAHNPFVVLLIGLDALVAVTGAPVGVALVTTMVVVSLVLRLHYERRMDLLAASLHSLVTPRVTVFRRAAGRGGERGAAAACRRNPRLLVPGDLVRLESGDVVPADCRIVHADNFAVDQSVLTGESMPIPKDASQARDRPAPTGSRGQADVLASPTLCLTGTTVAAGTATVVVAKTGAGTVLGAISRNLAARRQPTSADLGLRAVTWLLIRLLAVLVPAVFALTVLAHPGTGWTQGALFAAAAAVALVPQMLPVILAAAHGRGLSALADAGVIVTRPAAVQDLGGIDVLCTDKTGTLTAGLPTLTSWLAPDGSADPAVLDHAVLHASFVDDPYNSLDTAILDHASQLDHDLAYTRYEKVAERATAAGRRIDVVVLDPADGPLFAVAKGAVAEVLGACTRVRVGGGVEPLTPARREQLDLLCDRLWRAGQRVLAVAYRPLADDSAPGAAAADLTLVGFLGFADPVKPGIADAVRRVAHRGVRTVVVTGDATGVAVAVCTEAGIPTGTPVTGAMVEQLDDVALATLAAGTTVFAEVDPLQKARVVRAIRAAGHTVGYLGDGVNDTAALRAADVGICVAGAAAVARHAADAILVHKDLGVIDHGIVEGRRAALNATKYLKATLSANLANVSSVLAASVLLPFLPLLPVQLLVQNLCYDVAQLALPLDRADPEQLRHPRRWSTRDIVGFVTCFALIGSVLDLATYALLAAVLPGNRALLQSAWFAVGLVSQVLAMLVLRTGRVPFLRSRPAVPVTLAALGACVFGLLALAPPGATLLGLRPLPGQVLLLGAALVLGHVLTLQAAKPVYRRLTGRWL